MRPQFLIFVLIVVLLLVALLCWRHPVQTAVSMGQPQATVQPTNAPATASTASQNTANTMPPTSPANQHPSFTTNHATLTEMIEQEIESRNKPIDFYGMVIDQNSNAISGVDIKAGIRHWVKMDPALVEFGLGSKEVHLERVTGTDGRFELSDASGDVFGIILTKNGYLLSPKTPRGFGGGTTGSYENPVIFKMWKKGSEEHLIGGSHVFGIDSGKTYTLNLVAGKKIIGQAEGDLLVSITRPPDAKPRDRYPWSFSIQVVQGGFAEPDPDDEFMYVAPESGYQPSIEMQLDPASSSWSPVIRDCFFLSSRNGQVYGSVNIEIDSIYNVHSAIQINYTLNPNGSRNLQP